MGQTKPKTLRKANKITGNPQVDVKNRDIDKKLLAALSTPELQQEAIAAFMDLLKNRSERTVLWYVARFVGNPRTVDEEKQKQQASITFNFAGVQMVGAPQFDTPTAPSLQE